MQTSRFAYSWLPSALILVALPLAPLNPRVAGGIQTTEPTTQAVTVDIMLARVRSVLLAQRANLDARIAEIERQIARYEGDHPSLEIQPIIDQELAAISSALTSAQINAINTRANYGNEHPITLRAQAAEETLSDRYEQSQRKYMEIDGQVGKLQQFNADAAELRRMRTRVEQRLEDIQVVEAIIKSANENTLAPPPPNFAK